jgi:CRP/FNR family transcriptional regulator, cyclic AMP receptor protein
MDTSADPLPRRKLTAGTVLFRQGDPGDCLYVIQRGSIGIFKELDTGRRRPIGTLEVGDLFGEMALVDGKPRMATAEALEDSELVIVPAEAFRQHLKKSSPFIRSVLSVLVGHLRRVDYDGSGAPPEIELFDDAQPEPASPPVRSTLAPLETEDEPD